MVWLRYLVCTALLGACAEDNLGEPRGMDERETLEAHHTWSADDERGAQAAGGRADALSAQTASERRRVRDPWGPVRRLVNDTAEANGLPGVSLTVYDADDAVVHEQIYGDFPLDRPVVVASASKLVAGLVIFALIGEGKLSLTDKASDVLKTSPDNITLKHLLSFTSGLASDAECLSHPEMTLDACAREILGGRHLALPGERFDYGGTHLQVAGRMAEIAGHDSFNELFRTRLAVPLGLRGVGFYNGARGPRDTENPLVAGGLRISVQDYAQLLSVYFHRGQTEDVTIGSWDLFEDAAREPYPRARIGYSPLKALQLPYHYGLASWLECEPSSGQSCSVISSPGKYGFTPWVDRKNQYYAILGMQLSSQNEEDGSHQDGVAEVSVNLQQQLKPLIEQALAAD